ncbi:MAG: hypothetical protein M3Z02_02900 [Actinomycetota bacterium]|nr:hypothetical protein [Actinomycetota bacterium]
MTCNGCGATALEAPLTWSTEVSERGRTWLCEGCTREQLRAIEGRLGADWWEARG